MFQAIYLIKITLDEKIGKIMCVYQSQYFRVKNRDLLVGIISNKLSMKNNVEWCQVFGGSSFPYGPVNNMKQVEKDFK